MSVTIAVRVNEPLLAVTVSVRVARESHDRVPIESVELPDPVTVPGDAETVSKDVWPVTEKATAPPKPPEPATFTVNAAVDPRETDWLAGVTEIEKSVTFTVTVVVCAGPLTGVPVMVTVY